MMLRAQEARAVKTGVVSMPYLRTLVACLAAMSTSLGALQPAAAQAGQFTCSEMLGFSETAQWYDGFVAAIPDPAAWQLRWSSGGSVDLWADPNYSGWGPSALTTRCRNGSSSPDRVVLNISGDYQTDPSWWAAKTSQVIENVHGKYPNVRLIALQPVVGGPNGGRCPISSPEAKLPFVRATFNYPYIKQGLAMDVGGDVVTGASPEVRTCSDYQAGDWAGHLPPGSAAVVGASVAAFWASNSPSAPPADDNPAPAPEIQSVAGLTVSFEELANPNRALTGQYPAGVIDWGSGAWWLSGPYGAFDSRSISFNGAGPTSATFAFVAPHHLEQLDVYNGGKADSTISLACDGAPGSQSNVASGQLTTLPSGFASACSSVTISSSNGWDTNFKNLVIDS